MVIMFMGTWATVVAERTRKMCSMESVKQEEQTTTISIDGSNAHPDLPHIVVLEAAAAGKKKKASSSRCNESTTMYS